MAGLALIRVDWQRERSWGLTPETRNELSSLGGSVSLNKRGRHCDCVACADGRMGSVWKKEQINAERQRQRRETRRHRDFAGKP